MIASSAADRPYASLSRSIVQLIAVDLAHRKSLKVRMPEDLGLNPTNTHPCIARGIGKPARQACHDMIHSCECVKELSTVAGLQRS
jgi:hypothetical protein